MTTKIAKYARAGEVARQLGLRIVKDHLEAEPFRTCEVVISGERVRLRKHTDTTADIRDFVDVPLDPATIARHEINYWIPAREYKRVSDALHEAATQRHTTWLGAMDTKYVQLYVDMRTGDFLVRSSDGQRSLSNAEIEKLFPAV